MIFIEFKEGQGLGNQLWLYFAALSISIRLKTQVKIINYNKFVGKNFIKLKQSRKRRKDYKYSFQEHYYYDPRINHVSHFFDQRFSDIKKNTYLAVKRDICSLQSCKRKKR